MVKQPQSQFKAQKWEKILKDPQNVLEIILNIIPLQEEMRSFFDMIQAFESSI